MIDERPDVLPGKLPPDRRKPMQREAFVRVVRALQFLNGNDPQQSTGEQGLDLRLREEMAFEILALDASDAPFRVNGRGWQLRDSAPALAANFGTYHLGLDIDTTGQRGAYYGCIVLDEVRVFPSGAAGIMEWQYGLEARILRPASSQVHPLETEKQPDQPPAVGTTSAPITRSRILEIVETGGNESAYVDGTNFTAIGLLGSSAQDVPDSYLPQPGTSRIVIWPGECFVIQALTANVATRVTFRGRFFLFGSNVGSGVLTS